MNRLFYYQVVLFSPLNGGHDSMQRSVIATPCAAIKTCDKVNPTCCYSFIPDKTINHLEQ